MTTGARLASLSGLSGVSAGQHLIAIKQSGATSGEMLVSRSSLMTGTAMDHLMDTGISFGGQQVYPVHIATMGGMMSRM